MEPTKATLLDRIEKGARIALWLAIASACVIVPLAYMNEKRAQSKAEAALQEEVKKAEEHADELAEAAQAKPKRLRSPRWAPRCRPSSTRERRPSVGSRTSPTAKVRSA